MDAPMPASKKLLVTLFCLYVLSALSNGVLSVALGDILAEFALCNTGQGLLNSSSQLGCLFSYLLIPLLQNRSGRAALLCVGVGLAGLMQALMGFSPGLWLFLFALFFCGLGQGFLDSGINSLVIGLSGEHGGRVVNLLHMCYSIGATLSPLLAHPPARGARLAQDLRALGPAAVGGAARLPAGPVPPPAQGGAQPPCPRISPPPGPALAASCGIGPTSAPWPPAPCIRPPNIAWSTGWWSTSARSWAKATPGPPSP